MHVYVIINTRNGKLYVGKANDPDKRWQGHLRLPTDSPLYRAIRKYGEEAFEFRIVERCASEAEAYVAEKRWVAALNSMTTGRGYNQNEGGMGSVNPSPETREKIRIANTGRRHTAATRAKLSAIVSGRPVSAETRAKKRANATGRTHSEETRRKIGAAGKGRLLGDEQRDRLSQYWKGRTRPKPSPESRRRMREAHLGKGLSLEHCANISAGLKGKPCSSETRAKISATQKGRKTGPLSQEHRAKISAANKGKVLSSDHRAKLRKPKPPRTPEHCARISAALKQRHQMDAVPDSSEPIPGRLSDLPPRADEGMSPGDPDAAVGVARSNVYHSRTHHTQ